MSGLCLYEFEDRAWDESCLCADHTVLNPDFDWINDHLDWINDPSIPGETCRTPFHELIEISSNIGDQSAARYVIQDKEQGVFSTLSTTKNMKLEQDSWSPAPNGFFPSSSDSNSIKEVSSLASGNANKSSFISNNTNFNRSDICENDTIFSDNNVSVGNNSFSDPLGDITQRSNAKDFFETSEEKDSSDFLYYGWPEIGSFDDVDRMFRNCDTTYELVASKEEKFNWLPSADDVVESERMLHSNFKFPPESQVVEDISENLDSSKSYSSHESAMTSAPVMFNGRSWSPEKSDSYMSFVIMNGSAIIDTEDGLNSKEQADLMKQPKNQRQFEGKGKKDYFENIDVSHVKELPNEVEQYPGNIPVFPAPYNQQQYRDSIKSEAKGLTNPQPQELSHASIRLQSKGFQPSFYASMNEGSGKNGNLLNHERSLPYQNYARGNSCAALHASVRDLVSGGILHCSGRKFENQLDAGVSPIIPTGLGTSNVLESAAMSSGLDDVSLEAATFLQLQHVMEQLDLKMKLCIRDSLYRLAQSAEQRHNHANLNGVCGDEKDAYGAFIAEGANGRPSFLDMETDTNPIDRAIAHLLFHRPAEATAVPGDSLPIKSPIMVHGRLSSLRVMANDLVVQEQTSKGTEKLASNR